MNPRFAGSRCIRCGTCCRKGGPCLHTCDGELIADKGLRINDLVTFRAGELAHDPYNRKVLVLPVEIIKIRGKEGGTECLFFEPDTNSCSIYSRRPVECRELMCWDTSSLRALFLKNTLSRKHVLGGSGMMDLVESYDRAFPPQLILRLVTSGSGRDLADLEKMKRMDRRFREMVRDKMGVPEETMDFLFGRPIDDLATAFKRAAKKR